MQKNPVGKLRKKQKAETNELILNMARDLFENLGYEKTTMRKVAAKAEISPGAIFKHFENKSALLAATLFNDIEKTQKRALNTIPQGTTLQRQFLYIAENFYKYYSIRPVLSKILVKHSLFIEGEWAKKFEDQTNRFIQKTVQLIKEAQKRKEIRKDTNAEILASVFFSQYLLILLTCVKAPMFDMDFAIKTLELFVNQTISGASLNN